MQCLRSQRLALFNPNATRTLLGSSLHQSRRPMSRWGAEVWLPLQDADIYGQGLNPQDLVDEEQQGDTKMKMHNQVSWRGSAPVGLMMLLLSMAAIAAGNNRRHLPRRLTPN